MLHRRLATGRCHIQLLARRYKSTSSPLKPNVPVDEDCIPLRPPYSITAHLASLPSPPPLSDKQYIHLHTLAALIPPKTGSPEFEKRKSQLEEMIRLVEGVKPQPGEEAIQTTDEIPDGRIWPENEGIQLNWDRTPEDLAKIEHKDGRELLKLAKNTLAGYYTTPRQQAGDVE